LKDSGIEAVGIRSLQLLHSGGVISIGRSQVLLSGFLGNVNLEQLFLGYSKSDIWKNLSDLMKDGRVDLESADILVLSIEALDSLPLNESASFESENALLRFLLKFGQGYRDLLRQIERGFRDTPESLCQCAVERIAHPFPPSLNSRIMSGFPEIFAKFRGSGFRFCGGAAAMVSKHTNFSADVTATQTL
jgi:hypothetical protein